MKTKILFFLSILAFSCQPKKSAETQAIEILKDLVKNRVIRSDFQVILDSARVNGTIVIHEINEDSLYCNDFSIARKRNLPASTFKIPNSIIGLETGVVTVDSTIFKWDGKKRRFKFWEKDMYLKEAFHKSCLPCYQELARDIGVDTMKHYLNKLGYMDFVVDSTNLDVFWIKGPAFVTPLSQADFLRRFYQGELPISDKAHRTMKNMMVIETNEDYILSGKTGWGVVDKQNTGWFVGHLKTKDKEYVFATLIDPQAAFDMDLFARTRKEVTYQAFKLLGIKITTP